MKFVVLFVVSAFAGMANAGEFGYTFYGSNLSVDDPDGSTNSTSYVAPFSGFFADTLKRDLRYQVEVFTGNVTLESGVNQVGQKVKYQGIRPAPGYPITASPGWNVVTSAPTFSIIPDSSVPSTGFLGRVMPKTFSVSSFR